MKDYQLKSIKSCKLPEAVYRQALWAVKDLPRMKEKLMELEEMLDFLLPLYLEEGKLTLTIAIGCTGGRHRSVALASALNDYFHAHEIDSVNINRDIDK